MQARRSFVMTRPLRLPDGITEHEIAGAVGSIELSQALAVNTKLKHLVMARNEMQDAGAIAMGAALEVNNVLTNMNLHGEYLCTCVQCSEEMMRVR